MRNLNLKIFFTICAIMAVAMFFVQPNAVFAGDDLKMFNFYQLKHKINDKCDVFIQPDMRFNDNIGEFNYYHIRTGLAYHAFKNLDLGATHRFLQSKNAAGKWLDENRIELEITPKTTLANFSLSDRSRFEYRSIEQSRDRWRYRNLIKAAYPAKIGKFEFTPYLSNEIFYDMEINKLNLNWATVGADRKISKNLLVGVFYLNELTRVGTKNEWDTNHVIGTKAAVSF